MNVLNIILIIGFYQTLIFAGIILVRKQKGVSDYFLFGLFLIYGITLLLGYLELYNRTNDYPFPFLINSSTPLIFLHGPAIWFYIKSLTTQSFRFKSKYLLHFLPFLTVVALLFFNTYRLSAEERIIMERTEAFKEHISFPLIISMVAIFTQGYFVWGLILIKNYKRRIKNYFSEISSIDLAWLKVLLITSVVFYAGTSLLYITDYVFRVFSYHWLQSIGYSYQAVFILVLGYRGYKQGDIFSSRRVSANIEPLNINASDNNAKTDKDKIFVKELLQQMDTQRPYLNSELTLASLAEKLEVHPDYLSFILNNKLNRNFFDFVNHYRVEEFKRICREENTSNFTIMGLAWDAGFNSKPTFNRVFKKATGITPGEYAKSLNGK